MYKNTRLNGNASTDKIPPSLKKEVPLLGPIFVPPSYQCLSKRSNFPVITPETAYLVPLTVVHPFYHSGLLNACPRCDLKDINWDGWNATGPREVYGLYRNERVIGYQLRCKSCKGGGKGKSSCCVTTNPFFWEKWEYWRIPRESWFILLNVTLPKTLGTIPIFNKRSAVTQELYNLIIELRPSLTSAGLAEHIKRKSLLRNNVQDAHQYRTPSPRVEEVRT